jgi:hypothetical protein
MPRPPLNYTFVHFNIFVPIQHAGIFSKLIKAGTPAQFTYILHNYLNNRDLTLIQRNFESTRRPTREECPGQPLGACIAQYLHKWYTVCTK